MEVWEREREDRYSRSRDLRGERYGEVWEQEREDRYSRSWGPKEARGTRT